jgi:hypothetical protein
VKGVEETSTLMQTVALRPYAPLSMLTRGQKVAMFPMLITEEAIGPMIAERAPEEKLVGLDKCEDMLSAAEYA